MFNWFSHFYGKSFKKNNVENILEVVILTTAHTSFNWIY